MAHSEILAEQAEFSDTFFPAPSDGVDLKRRPPFASNPFAKLLEADTLTESVFRARFVEAINNNNLTPGLKLCECGGRPEPSPLDPTMHKVDTAFFRNDSDSLAPTDGRQRWPDQIIPMEFKRNEVTLGPWDGDKDNNIGASTISPGEIIKAELLYAIQHRVTLFMLVIIGTTARFVHWDRSGTVVTRPFDYVEDWEFFCDILWRISLCTDAQLGLDPTATRLRPSESDYDRMTAAAKPHANDVDERERDLAPEELPAGGRLVYKYVRTMFSESVNSPWLRYRVEVLDGKATRHLLIAKPTFRARGMFGRGTRGYVALDCKTGDLVWLKDTWRAHYLLVDKEGDVLRRLNKAKVMNVPTLICHGDIQDQVTLTPEWWEAKNPPSSSKPKPDSSSSPSPSSPSLQTLSTMSSSASRKRKRDDERSHDSVPPPKGVNTGFSVFRDDCPLRLHKHYRLVEKEVGMPLVDFQHGRQLVSVVLDCIYAHFDAATKPEVQLLHRDVSGGNILIRPCVIEDESGAEIKWRGLLTDWEMSKPKDHQTVTEGQARQPERTGTWQFLSVALLSRPKEVEICDELEAFFYVLLYYGVRYLRSNIDESAVGNWISAFFDTYGVKGDTYICGEKKLAAIKNGMLLAAATQTTSTFVKFNSPLDGIFEDLLKWFKAHHVVTEYELEEDQLTGVPPLGTLQASSGSAPPRKGRQNPRPRPRRGDKVRAPRKSLGRPAAGQPSAEDEEFCKYVLTHDEMMDRLEEALDIDDTSVQWTVDDKVGDRVAKGFRPSVQAAGPTLPASLASNKRRKVDGPQFAVSLPILPSRLPPKTPERKRAGIPHHTTGYAR
ncbi:hypothetical protein LXA43DRAFT_607339 [Ganoderma leucocontextum]|nr:hypothetical protein LXA43DRAFT_607339 [Ganoderma leucocontextum]